MPDQQTRDADLVVVGAGLAGLSAARAAASAGASVGVVEARDRVGGRTLNEEIGDGQVIEVGGQWSGPTQDRLAALARELLVDTFPRVNPVVLLDVQRAQRRLNRMALREPIGALHWAG